MLVLRRSSGQHIALAGTIRITVLRVQGSQVTLGIEAPADVLVLRGELTPLEKLPERASPPSAMTASRRPVSLSEEC